MKKLTTVGAVLLTTTSIAHAGGLDRSGQDVSIIFEEGNVAQLSYGYVDPDLTGSTPLPPGDSGDIAPAYSQLGAGIKVDINERLSVALILDQPFGALVDYDTAGYLLTGTNAKVESTGVTGLVRYKLDDGFSVHGGLRQVSVNGVYDVVFPGDYDSTYSSDSGIGYVIGTAYERPEIALRVALTYSSEIRDFALAGTPGAGDLSTDTPQSINLDFQTGVAADTLVFGSVRWVEWGGFQLVDSVVPQPILEYDEDVITYNIGVGRRLSDALAVSFSVGYEAATDEPTGNLGPTDGYISYQVGGSYDFGNGLELSGGIRYVDLGDATTEGISAEFEDNSALGVGVQVAYNF